MPDIALQTYNQEIKDLIDHAHFDEAIAHCQHILETFPKCIETYRLLAKAFLEQSRHGDAADVFQRVLSVEPDDWLSHVAMAIVREDESNLDMAIWHMERAYEVNPSNTTVQQEIRRLRGKRDGVEPPKLRLTRAALARMYIKGGLFSQAVAEIRSALSDDPDRPDLQVLLASALYESGDLQEAAEICNNLLKKLPYCRDANRILGLVLWNTGKQEEAEKFFQRLISLDPYIDADTLKTENCLSTHPVQGILLPKLEWEAQLKTDKTSQPSWAASLGIKIEEPQSTSGNLPEWLNTPAVPKSAPAPTPAFSGTPDWLGEATASVGEAAAAPPAGLPDWLAGSSDTAAQPFAPSAFSALSAAVFPKEPDSVMSAPESFPGWVHGTQEPVKEQTAQLSDRLPPWANASLFGSTEKAPEAPPPQPDFPSVASGISNFGKSGIGTPVSFGTTPLQSAQPSPELAAEEVPDWIKAATGTAPAAENVPISNLPDWLSAPPPAQVEGLPASSLEDWAKPETSSVPQVTGTSQLPDWLSSTRPRDQVAEAEPEWIQPLPKTGTASAVPEWMQGISPVPAAESIKPEEVPDWLSPQESSQKSDVIPQWMQTGDERAAAAPAWMQEEPTAAGNIPDWMKPEPESLPASTPQPESLSEMDAGKGKPQEPIPIPPPIIPAVQPIPAPAVPNASAEPAPQMPDWLTGPAQQEAAQEKPATPFTGQPIPAMASSMGAEEPVSPAPSLPDWLTGPMQPAAAPIATVAVPPVQGMASPIPMEEPISPAPSLPDWLTGTPSPVEVPPLPATEITATGRGPVQIPASSEAQKTGAETAIPATMQQSAAAAVLAPEPLQEQSIDIAAQRPAAPQLEPTAAAEPSIPSFPRPPTAGIQSAAPVQPAAVGPNIPPVSPPAPPSASAASTVPAKTHTTNLAALEATPPNPASSLPLPDWLRPVKPAVSSAPVQDWDTAAQQMNRQGPSGLANPPATPPAVAEVAAGTDSQQTVDPVARWLDRRLKTSTLRSLDEVTKGKPKTGELGAQKPSTGTLTPPGPAPKQQIPTWLDYQRPGASDTVVQWIDRKAPATGRLMEEKLQPPPGEKIPTKPLVKSSSGISSPTAAPTTTATAENPEWLDRVKKTEAAPAAASSSASPAAAARLESAKPSPAPVSLPPQELSPGAYGRDARQNVNAAIEPVGRAAAGSGDRARDAQELEEEDDGSPVPPPEWLQKALGKAVSDVPPVPAGRKEHVSWDEAVSSAGQPSLPRTPVPAKVPKYEQPHSFPQGTLRTDIPAQAKRMPTQILSDGRTASSGEETPDVPIQKTARIWRTPTAEEPPPAQAVEAGRWMPIRPEERGVPSRQKGPASQPLPAKSSRPKARKITEVELNAMLKEARAYLETDLTKAAEVYHRVIDAPAYAPAVCEDLQTYLEQDPDSAALWNLLGDAYSKSGRLPDAYRAYAEALRRMG